MKLKIAQSKKVKVAKCAEKTQSTPITRSSESEDNLSSISRNNSSKMPPAASPPVMPWAPILFPPWNPGLLNAAFYPAALRSLPTWVHSFGKRQKMLRNRFQMLRFPIETLASWLGISGRFLRCSVDDLHKLWASSKDLLSSHPSYRPPSSLISAQIFKWTRWWRRCQNRKFPRKTRIAKKISVFHRLENSN